MCMPEILLGFCLALLLSSTSLRSAQDDTGVRQNPSSTVLIYHKSYGSEVNDPPHIVGTGVLDCPFISQMNFLTKDTPESNKRTVLNGQSFLNLIT